MTEKIEEKSLVLRSNGTVPAADMPRASKSEVLERHFAELTSIEDQVRAGCHVSILEKIQEAVDLGERVTANAGFEDLRKWLGSASRPATKDEIAKQMAGLLACFPGNREPIFGRVLCEDVGALQPSIGGLESACRSLRRTCTFMPVIAEVIEAVQLAEGRFGYARRNMVRIREHLDGARANLRLQIQKQIEQQKRYQEKQVAECVGRWKQGKPVYKRTYESSSIEEARQRYRQEHDEEPPDLLAPPDPVF